jgi:hypothetical protein
MAHSVQETVSVHTIGKFGKSGLTRIGQQSRNPADLIQCLRREATTSCNRVTAGGCPPPSPADLQVRLIAWPSLLRAQRAARRA